MSDIVKDAKALGYVETLLHRRRYIPDITSRNFNLRGFAERICYEYANTRQCCRYH
ncbi:DNA polymerase [Staphylococcus aureus]